MGKPEKKLLRELIRKTLSGKIIWIKDSSAAGIDYVTWVHNIRFSVRNSSHSLYVDNVKMSGARLRANILYLLVARQIRKDSKRRTEAHTCADQAKTTEALQKLRSI